LADDDDDEEMEEENMMKRIGDQFDLEEMDLEVLKAKRAKLAMELGAEVEKDDGVAVKDSKGLEEAVEDNTAEGSLAAEDGEKGVEMMDQDDAGAEKADKAEGGVAEIESKGRVEDQLDLDEACLEKEGQKDEGGVKSKGLEKDEDGAEVEEETWRSNLRLESKAQSEDFRQEKTEEKGNVAEELEGDQMSVVGVGNVVTGDAMETGDEGEGRGSQVKDVETEKSDAQGDKEGKSDKDLGGQGEGAVEDNTDKQSLADEDSEK
jgi:hypothetical protein